MEKLKAKHDHKLTDILKVMIFALFLILPGLIVLPSMLYYGVNEYATAPTEQVEIYEYKQVNFNQQIIDGNFENTNNHWSALNASYTISNSNALVVQNSLSTSSDFGLQYTNFNFASTHKYLLKLDLKTSIDTTFRCRYPFISDYTSTYTTFNNYSFIFNDFNNDRFYFQVQHTDTIITAYFDNIMCFDLTQMFGVGKEPTIEQFNQWYVEEYYPYTLSEIQTLEIDTGETETYTDITSQIQYNWTSLWKQPLFNWTNYTIVKQGIDNFTNVFGITNTSNISNLIAYELIIVAIYIVIDIVLTLFKWLTHLIGEK